MEPLRTPDLLSGLRLSTKLKSSGTYRQIRVRRLSCSLAEPLVEGVHEDVVRAQEVLRRREASAASTGCVSSGCEAHLSPVQSTVSGKRCSLRLPDLLLSGVPMRRSFRHICATEEDMCDASQCYSREASRASSSLQSSVSPDSRVLRRIRRTPGVRAIMRLWRAVVFGKVRGVGHRGFVASTRREPG